MPMIHIEFDADRVKKDEVSALSNAIQKIVSSVTQIGDVFVYANSSQIRVKVAPVEIFVRMSAPKIENMDQLTAEIKSGLRDWKKKNSFKHPINLTVIPMNWKVEIGI